MNRKTLELMVGLFMMMGFLALLFLAFKVSGLVLTGHANYYFLTAEFDNVGDLKVRSPVAVSGVVVGQVTNIKLDSKNFRALVTMKINSHMNLLPTDSAAEILTQGILGSNYISIVPGLEQINLKNGDRIETTRSAIILENLIGQLIFHLKNNKPAVSTSGVSS